MKAQRSQARTASGSDTPSFGRLAYLAVTSGEIALITLKSGVVSLHLDKVISRVRSAIASAELGGGGIYSPPLTITFANGGAWELEVPRPSKKQAQSVVDALNSN